MRHRTTMLRPLIVFVICYLTNVQSFDLSGLPTTQDIRNSKVNHHRQALCMLKPGSEICYNSTKSPGDAGEVGKLISIVKYADSMDKNRPQGINADADKIKYEDDDKSGENNDKTENNENDDKTENNENDDKTENNENDDKTENNDNDDNENVGNTNSDQPIYEDADHKKGDLETNKKTRL